jgi:hypothetical protein
LLDDLVGKLSGLLEGGCLKQERGRCPPVAGRWSLDLTRHRMRVDSVAKWLGPTKPG